ncbi:MAG: nicotinate dehydrogenase large molybdopterin subunit [Firmicutes bacterium]|nr:nicotinate dehydrogenase large molybdopterin subunit [Bacillota bacterium]
MSYHIIGKRIPRHDAEQQVTGKIIYGEDLYRPGMLHAKALYSEHSHAEILSIDTTQAEKLAGVRGIITHKDVPVNRYGLSHKDQPVLADDKVRVKGDALAVVAADTLEIAKKALKLIKVEYKPLKPVLDPVAAMAEDAPLVHGDSNIAAHIKIRSGDVEAGFAQSDLIIEENFYTPKNEHCHIEPHVALAEVENDGKLVIWTSTSRPFSFSTQLTRILKLPMNKYQMKTPAVGGGFGGKNEVTLEPWVALLAMKTKRPVRMVFTREEEFEVSTLRHPYLMKYKTGVKKDGTLLAREIRLISDNGAYVGLGNQTLTKAAVHAAGPYKIANVKTDAFLVYTNAAVGGAMRGFGVPQVCFAYESHTDSIAEKLGLDPLEYRLRTLYGDIGTMPTGQMLQSKPLIQSLRRAAELADYCGKGGDACEEER